MNAYLRQVAEAIREDLWLNPLTYFTSVNSLTSFLSSFCPNGLLYLYVLTNLLLLPVGG